MLCEVLTQLHKVIGLGPPGYGHRINHYMVMVTGLRLQGYGYRVRVTGLGLEG